MKDHDPIAHLDFPTPEELAFDGETVTFKSLEADRIKLLCAFFDHLHDLETRYGQIDHENPKQYVDRLRMLEARMEKELFGTELSTGDTIQAHVPHIIYPEGFSAEFDASEAVRARFEGLAIYPHFAVARDGELKEHFKFGLNFSISNPVIVTPLGISSLDQVGEINPLVSLHHEQPDFQLLAGCS